MRRLETKTTIVNVHAFSSFALFPAHPWLIDGELLAFCLATKKWVAREDSTFGSENAASYILCFNSIHS